MEKTYKVKGMHCASCAKLVKGKVMTQAWVEACDINVATNTATIQSLQEPDILQINNNLKDYGYELIDEAPKIPDHMQHTDHWIQGTDQSINHVHEEVEDDQWPTIRLVLMFVVLSFLYMGLDVAGKYRQIIPEMPKRLYTFWHHLFPVIATITFVLLGKPALKSIGTFARTGHATMDTLIWIGTWTAFLYSFVISAFEWELAPYLNVENHFYDVVIVVIGLVYFGKYLESRAKKRTAEAIESLIWLQPKTATLKHGEHIKVVPLNQLQINDIVVVKPGEKVPVDGEIIFGETFIDESMISWEPLPVEKQVWDMVIGSTINGDWIIHIKATKLWAASMLGQIIALVQKAQMSRAPIQNLVDNISSVFVPAVLVIALLTFVLRAISWDWITGLTSAIAVLVVACPCAMGLATPTAIMAGIGLGAKHGILIKNAEALQKFSKIDMIVFDKTGTITLGKPTISDYQYSEHHLQILASLELNSEHPLAHAIVKHAQEQWLALLPVENRKMTKGKWVQWTIEWTTRYAWNMTYMEELGVETQIEQHTKQWKTPVILTDLKQTTVFALSDTIKPWIKQTLEWFHNKGIKTVMLTGDNEQTANYIASQIWIDTVIAQVLPGQKADYITQLKNDGYKVAMIGDGVNDAPALAFADVSIAMSTGTDVAIHAADVTLLHGDLNNLSKAYSLSKKTMNIIIQNLFRAFGYNILLIPIATGMFIRFGLWLHPAFAWAAMAFSSICVVLNSLRLKRI